MRKLLAFVFCLLALAGTARAQAPAQAAAVGYNLLTYGPSLIVGTDPTVTPLQSGTNWQPFNFFGTAWQPYGVTTNANGSINIPTNTINGFGAQLSTAAFTASPSPYIKGTAFGGGFYAEVTMSFAINPTTGGPAFWANDIESMAGGSAGDLTLRHWPGQVSNYGDWIENDIAEFDSGVPANQYGISLHNFFGPPGWFGGESFVSGNELASSGNIYTETVASCATNTTPGAVGPSGTGSGIVDGTCLWNFVSSLPSNGEISTNGSGSKITFPTGTDLTQPHKYGVLWVPATGAAQGFVRYYFDNSPVGNACTWNQYNSALAPPPADISNPCGGSSAYSIMDQRHMALVLGNATASGGTPGAVTVYTVNVWQNSAAQDIGPTNPPPTSLCSGTPGCALPSGYLSVSGNQFIDSTGNKNRIASVSYRGTPTDQATMNAIRQAGFNAIRIDWRDAYLASGGSGTTTFDDEFTSAPWIAHEAWVSGDKWSFAGTAFHTGVAQGPTWWANPIDTPAAASVYTDSGTSLNLSLINNPSGSGISPTACDVGGVGGQPCTTIGALINNQLTPGGLVQLFGDFQFSVAVPSTPGFLFQWDIECQPSTCSDGGMEYDVGIWTDASSVQHVQFSNQCCGGNIIYFGTTSVDITKQHVYEVNWQTANTTFYIDGVQQFQTATPGGEFQTSGALSYFLTSDATYFGYSTASPNAANLPATASLDWYRIYQTKPTGTAPVGCNSLTQMDQCVALAAAATPQPLKVIFSHRGNEIPNGACAARQANGLWFDSGGSSGNDDGCGDGGNVTYSQFKANTVALMRRYAGNSTVIGYDFHAEPLINGSFTGTSGGGGGGSGGFTANNGQIFDPNGVAWAGRGFNVTIEDVAAGFITPANIQSLFPRVNYIRISNFLGGGYRDSITPDQILSQVNALTNLGIRVEFSDYAATNTGDNGCRGDTDLAAANAWYRQWSAFYASNPFVTWESQNECQTPGWQAQVTSNYNAVRGGAPNAQFVIGLADGNYQINYEIDQSQLNLMSNVVFDGHPYAGGGGCGGSAANCGAQQIAGTQVFKALSTNTETNIPMIMGEVGDGVFTNPDPDGLFSIQAVFNNMSTGGSTSTNNGIGYWLWYCGQPWPASCTDNNDINKSDQLVKGSTPPPFPTLYTGGSEGTTQYFQGAIAAAPGSGPTPFTGGTPNPPVNWNGGGDTDIMAAANDVGAAVFAVNPGVIQFVEGPLNNGANNLLSGAAKP